MTADLPVYGSSLPTLFVPAPECGWCWNEVQLDADAAWCEHCLVEWERIEDGLTSRPDLDVLEEHGPTTCGVLAEITSSVRVELPCVLPPGHASAHRHPWTIKEPT